MISSDFNGSMISTSWTALPNSSPFILQGDLCFGCICSQWSEQWLFTTETNERYFSRSSLVLCICKHTLSVVRIANVVMLMVLKWWTAEIELAIAAARRRSWSPFHLILLSSCCLPCAGSAVKISPWAYLNHLAEENKPCKNHDLSFCCLRAESACRKI